MAKRPYPWEEAFQRQSKQHVNERMTGNNEAHMQEIYGARRAASNPGIGPEEAMPGGSNQPVDDMEMDDYEDYEMTVEENATSDNSEVDILPDFIPGPAFPSSCSLVGFTVEEAPAVSSRGIGQTFGITRRHSRLDKLKNMERRDPSPIPTSQNLLTGFINTTRRIHGPLTDAEKESLLQQAKHYKQLNMDSFVMNRVDEEPNHNYTRRDKNKKDENDNSNKPMEF